MTKFKRRLLKTFLSVVGILVIIFCWQLYLEYHANDHPFELFTFDDPQATYVIKYYPFNDQYNIVYDTLKDREKLDTCDEPDGGISRCWVEGDFHTDIPIASSPVDLAEFVDKNVKVNGEFVFADKQCIKEKCVSLGSRTVSLQLESISHEKTQTK